MTGNLSERIGDLGHRLAVRRTPPGSPRAPTRACRLRACRVAVAAYALSRSDLIPDFIPVLGWLDDLIIVPRIMGSAPPDPRRAMGRTARRRRGVAPIGRTGTAFILLLWAGMHIVYWSVRTSPWH